MSRENLNVNEVNPLEEKSDKIDTSLEKLGLDKPGRVIPTDVDYFLRKEKGELEPKYTFNEALAKSFEIDNLFVSGFNKFMEDDGPAIDFDFEPTKEMFNEIIADIIEFPERARTYKYITPEMVQHANLGSRALDEILNVVAASGREGWSDISKARLTNYFPHTHSNVKVLQAIDEYGIDAVERIYANALESIRPDIDEALFKRMITGIVRRVSSQEYRGKENMFSRGFQGTDQAGMREFLEEIGLTNKQIDEVMSKFKKPDGNTLDPNARRRLPFVLSS